MGRAAYRGGRRICRFMADRVGRGERVSKAAEHPAPEEFVPYRESIIGGPDFPPPGGDRVPRKQRCNVDPAVA